jgi:hypothetical protein
MPQPYVRPVYPSIAISQQQNVIAMKETTYVLSLYLLGAADMKRDIIID